MDHSKHLPLAPHELTQTTLVDATVYGPNDEKIGTISHVHGLAPITGVVVDVGGFLGLGAKPVLLDISELRLMRDENGDVHAVTHWTKDQLKELPEHHH